MNAAKNPCIGANNVPLHRRNAHIPRFPEELCEDASVVGVHCQVDKFDSLDETRALLVTGGHTAIQAAGATTAHQESRSRRRWIDRHRWRRCAATLNRL